MKHLRRGGVLDNDWITVEFFEKMSALSTFSVHMASVVSRYSRNRDRMLQLRS